MFFKLPALFWYIQHEETCKMMEEEKEIEFSLGPYHLPLIGCGVLHTSQVPFCGVGKRRISRRDTKRPTTDHPNQKQIRD